MRLLRTVAAGTLAVAIAVAGAGQPAQAAPQDNSATNVSAQAFDWVTAVLVVAGSVFGGGSSSDLDAAIQQVIAAIEASEVRILNHVDAIASAEVQACARSHTIEFADINFMSTSVRQLWAQEATRCAGLASAYLDAVQSKQATDNIGHVIGEIYAIAIAARAKAGLVNGIDLLIRDQIRSYETLVVKLAPACTEDRVIERDFDGRVVIVEIQYHCVAYNGDDAFGIEVWRRGTILVGRPLDREAVANYATRNTSRAVAQTALPRLRSALP
ncbi:hypothetical protein Prum_076320 [Phytohabitans rumicis]|uniref:Lipoprotein n=2 Tax=Phytohabitans rumicis TaxID=1076125 RepID=A0A6V8LEA5_9ACTN|nr:hypothetical protein Prum_076320 [Phytohabitans rumicis]